MGELIRVCKPEGRLLATVSASMGNDWYHEPSRGWCFSEKTLRRIFRLRGDVASNFEDRQRIMTLMKSEDNGLQERLASFYFKSGDNGMPWGRWDPQYLPVGVVR